MTFLRQMETGTAPIIRLFSLLLCFISVSTHADSSENTDAEGHITVSHAIAMHGKPKYAANFSHFDYTSEKATKGGTIRQFGFGSFDSFNSFVAKGNPADGLGLLFDTLMAPSADEPFSMYGLIAETIEYPDDRSWVIFNINPKARFNDGHPVDASDVVFTFNTLMEKGSPLYQFYYQAVDHVEKLGVLKVKFVFKEKNNRELPLIVGQLPVFPEHFWRDKDFSESTLEVPLGSGPYVIGSYDSGRQVVFRRAADYWAIDHPVNRYRYNFDRIIFDYYRDMNVALEGLKAGEYDIRKENVSKFWAVSYNGPGIQTGALKKETFADHTPAGLQAFFFNLRKPKFQNMAMRKALLYAFDFEWTNDALFYGAYRRSKSFFENSELASSGLPEGRELDILNEYKDQLREEVFTTPYAPPVTDGSGRNRPNLRKAKAFLDAAGYKVVDNQLIDPDTQQPVTIEFLAYLPTFERVINPYIQNLKILGIQAHIRMVDTSQYINRLRNFDFDIMSRIQPQGQSPGNEQFELWSSTSADRPGAQNYTGIKHPVVDALLQRIVSAPTREELVAVTRALDRVLLHENIMVPQWYLDQHRIAYWDKFDHPETLPLYDVSFQETIYTWWYNPQKAARVKKLMQGN